MSNNITFEIKEKIAVLNQNQSGWNKELNIVSWNDGTPKYDIREWNEDHTHMSRGLTLNEEEMKKGVIITVCSQCLQGKVSLGTYETSRGLSEVGAVSGMDMTTEAAVAKLYYLFSIGCGKDIIKEKMSVNLCGELSE